MKVRASKFSIKDFMQFGVIFNLFYSLFYDLKEC